MKTKLCLVTIAGLLIQHSIAFGQVNNGQQNNRTQQFNNQQQNGAVQQGNFSQANQTQGNQTQQTNGLLPQQGNTNPNNLIVQQNPQQPDWWPLQKAHQDFLDPVLDYWAFESSKIEHLQSSFIRWDYDPQFCAQRNADRHLYAYRTMRGIVKYSKPDKGMYEVTNIWRFGPPKEGGTEPEYQAITEKEQLEQQKEKWICDGAKIYAFNFMDKQLHEIALPPEMQGNGLANSPLPFLFGVQTAQLKQRYWIRPLVPPQGVKDQYWIEAWPKRREDAQQYKFVRVIIARKDFLPQSIQVFAPNYDEVTNPASMAIQFENRTKNWKASLQDLVNFRRFYEVQTPFGWKKITGKLTDSKPVDPNSAEFRAMQEKAGQGIR